MPTQAHPMRPPQALIGNAHARQSGVVLIVALVMLIVISIASVAVMKGAINTDSVADNNRRQGQAMQGAQAGLRYCENLVTSGDLVPAAVAPPNEKEKWKTFGNWQSDEFKREVTATFLATAGSKAPSPTKPPSCMAQFRALETGGEQVVIITARGFSDNYVENTSGQTQAGSVVWLQSILQLAAN